MSSELVPHSTIEEIVGHRDKALELYRVAYDRIREADAALKAAHDEVRLAAQGGHNEHTHAHAPEIDRFYNAVALPNSAEFFRVSKRVTDLRVWGHLIEFTDLQHLMDHQAKDELRQQMAYVPEQVDGSGKLINQEEIEKGLPEVTVETIVGTLKGFAEDADTIFVRGLANAFSKLDRRFRSHDGFKIGSRVILSNAFEDSGCWSYHNHMKDTLIDIERVFLILDGKGPRATYAGIVGVVDRERKELGIGWSNLKQSEHEGDYFKVRCFKNGNAHLWFTRKDLVEQANKLLAGYYGEVIGDGKDNPENEPDVFSNPTLVPAKHFGFYPTPKTVVELILQNDPLYLHKGETPKRILEPSAGTGAIAQALAAVQRAHSSWGERDSRTWKHHVTCVEIQPELAEGLRASGLYAIVHNRDFLTLSMGELRAYDLIVMNPPFDMQRDIDHVMHAWKFLKPGGELIAIMSAGVEFRQNKKAVTFRKLVETHKGRFTDLPAGSFTEVGTNVNTCFVRVTK